MTNEGINTDAAKQVLANVETRVSLHDDEMLKAELTRRIYLHLLTV